MEHSPRMLPKQPTRLSLSRRAKNDSPKTPSRLRTSPVHVDTPPSAVHLKLVADQSTPLTRYKRTCFVEESPSQDYDSDPPASFPCSQAETVNIIDVGWQWEKQCPNVARQPRRIETTRPAAAPPPSTRSTRAAKQLLPPVQRSESDEKRGFYKFKEELLQNFNNPTAAPSLEDSVQTDELDSSLKENDFTNFRCDTTSRKRKLENGFVQSKLNECKVNEAREIVKAPLVIKPTTNPKPMESTKQSSEANFLDDSDDDGFLVQCSQRIEEVIQQNTNLKPKSLLKTAAFENDSFDDIFLSIPTDDKLLDKAVSSSNQCRSPLVRYKSMPVKSPSAPAATTTLRKQSAAGEKTKNSNFSRHSSMPVPSDKQQTISCSNSRESKTTEKRLCSSQEIERKRLEAMQRLKERQKLLLREKTGAKNRVNFGR